MNGNCTFECVCKNRMINNERKVSVIALVNMHECIIDFLFFSLGVDGFFLRYDFLMRDIRMSEIKIYFYIVSYNKHIPHDVN